MKAKIIFDDGREATIELTPEQVQCFNIGQIHEPAAWRIMADNGGLYYTNDQAVNRKPLHTFRHPGHADLLIKRFELEMEMFRWASEMNEGWVPDWVDRFTSKYGIVQYSMSESLDITQRSNVNDFLFGLAFKSEEIAEQAKEIFGGRILSLYGKQF